MRCDRAGIRVQIPAFQHAIDPLRVGSDATVPTCIHSPTTLISPFYVPQRRAGSAPRPSSRRDAGGAAGSFDTTASIALTSRSEQCSSLLRSDAVSGPAIAPGFGRSTAAIAEDVLGRPGAIAAAAAGRPGAIAGGLAGGAETDSIAAVARARTLASMTLLSFIIVPPGRTVRSPA